MSGTTAGTEPRRYGVSEVALGLDAVNLPAHDAAFLELVLAAREYDCLDTLAEQMPHRPIHRIAEQAEVVARLSETSTAYKSGEPDTAWAAAVDELRAVLAQTRVEARA